MGQAADMDIEDSRDDGNFAQRIPVDCGEAELRGGFVLSGTVRRTCGQPFC